MLRRLDQLTGAAREVIEPHRALAPLEASHALDEPTADRFALSHVLRQLVERLARQLAARDQGAVLLMCFLRCTDGRTVPLRIGLLQPSANARQLLELVDLHLETVALAAEVDRVELRVAVVGRLGERQSELFADRWPSDPHQLALLVNRLSSRLGHEQVLRAEPCASPVPEASGACSMPLMDQQESGRGGRRRRGAEQGCRRPICISHSPPLRHPPLSLPRSRSRWKWSALRPTGRRNLCGSRIAASGSCISRGRSGSKLCGGAGLRCGAITTAWHRIGQPPVDLPPTKRSSLVPAWRVRVIRKNYHRDTEDTEKQNCRDCLQRILMTSLLCYQPLPSALLSALCVSVVNIWNLKVRYAELHCKTNFSFLEGASHAEELVRQAAELGYRALAVTDRNSLAGVVRAHIAAKEVGLPLVIGAEITPSMRRRSCSGPPTAPATAGCAG